MKQRLTDEEQDRLLREFKKTRDPEIRSKLILHNQTLASWYARKSTGYERYADDIEQAAVIGIMRAVDGFDPDKGFKFSSYASAWVRSEIQEFHRMNSVVPLKRQDSQALNADFSAGRPLNAQMEYFNDIRNILTLDMPAEFGGNVMQAKIATEDEHGEEQTSYVGILKELIPRLPPESQVIIMSKLSGKQISGIAKDLGRSPEYTRKRYHVALSQLHSLAEMLGVRNPFNE